MTITDAPVDVAKEAGLLGTRLLRKEDPELLTGEARFVDDLDITGALWVACVRSPHAHARIRSVDLAGALAAEGVVAAYSGVDLAEGWGPLPCAWPVTDDMKNPAHLPVAKDKANYVGDIVAVVLANDRYRAVDAATLVEVDIAPSPPTPAASQRQQLANASLRQGQQLANASS